MHGPGLRRVEEHGLHEHADHERPGPRRGGVHGQRDHDRPDRLPHQPDEPEGDLAAEGDPPLRRVHQRARHHHRGHSAHHLGGPHPPPLPQLHRRANHDGELHWRHGRLHTHRPAGGRHALVAADRAQDGQVPGARQEPERDRDTQLRQRDRLGQDRHAHPEQDVRGQCGRWPRMLPGQELAWVLFSICLFFIFYSLPPHTITLWFNRIGNY